MQLAQLRVSRLSNVESPHIVMHTHARVVRASKSSYYSNERPLAATHGQTQTAAKKSMPSPTGVRTTIKWETGQRESAECFAVCVCVCVRVSQSFHENENAQQDCVFLNIRGWSVLLSTIYPARKFLHAGANAGVFHAFHILAHIGLTEGQGWCLSLRRLCRSIYACMYVC